MDKQKIINLLFEIKNDLENIEKQFNYFSSFTNYEPTKEFEQLKHLLDSEEWPEAVLDFQIVDKSSEEEKMCRAEGIVDILIDEDLQGKKFLDFGCGEGHTSKYVSREADIAVGFDINQSDKSNFIWEKIQEKMLLTTDINLVRQLAPYDVILIYDVLDHADDPVDVLNQAKSFLADDGKIYLRTHPWCGRHGGHFYQKKNKAFVHVVFSDKELEKLGLNYEEKINKFKFPIVTYENIIKNSGLNIKFKDIEHQDVEIFFEKNKIIADKIKTAMTTDDSFPKFQLSQCFHDYVLNKV
jgi:2-polyprenyl-3-methyl-5-hydroxy-6-metoxy-1,4-benzoquinol methylase